MKQDNQIATLKAQVKRLKLSAGRRERCYFRLFREVIEADQISQTALLSLGAAMQQLARRNVN
jgi:hypothetical protein